MKAAPPVPGSSATWPPRPTATARTMASPRPVPPRSRRLTAGHRGGRRGNRLHGPHDAPRQEGAGRGGHAEAEQQRGQHGVAQRPHRLERTATPYRLDTRLPRRTPARPHQHCDERHVSTLNDPAPLAAALTRIRKNPSPRRADELLYLPRMTGNPLPFVLFDRRTEQRQLPALPPLAGIHHGSVAMVELGIAPSVGNTHFAGPVKETGTVLRASPHADHPFLFPCFLGQGSNLHNKPTRRRGSCAKPATSSYPPAPSWPNGRRGCL